MKTIQKIFFLTFLFWALFLSKILSANVQPNIIIFLVDDMGAMDTSVTFIADKEGRPKKYPLNEMYHTPAMEKLSAGGCRFLNAYAMSVCSPSRVSIMTGQNSARHGVTNWINPHRNNGGKFGPADWNWEGIKKGTDTIPSLLRANGYRTIHVGKAHFGPLGSYAENPINIGFDVNVGGCAWGQPGSYYGEKNFVGDRGQNPVPNLERYFGKDIFLTDALTLEAKREIKKCADEKKPFFLYMSHYAVHSPFQPDKRFIGRYGKYKSSTSKDWPAFASMIESMDKSLSDILEYLDLLGIAEDTLVIFLGDNGSDARILPVSEVEGPNISKVANAAPLRGMKASKYEGGMRIPLIVSWAKPDKLNKNQQAFPVLPGSFVNSMAVVYDLLPTIMSITGTSYDKSISDGESLCDAIAGSSNSDRLSKRKFLMHYPHEHRCRYFTVLRDGDWKLIRNYEDGSYELYNLKSDISESRNLASDHPQKLNELKSEMDEILKSQKAKMPNL